MKAKTTARGFLYGGMASCLAEGLTIPLDVLKVRMQLQGEQGQKMYRNTFQAVVDIARLEGIGAFLKGLKPALLRQGTYGTCRVGLYAPIKQLIGVHDASDDVFWRKVIAGMLAGSVSAAIFNPTDLIKVRMQVDGMRPNHSPPSYKGVVDATVSIVRGEGVTGLYTGVGATASRAAVVAAAELASYDEVKQRLRMYYGEGMQLHLMSSLIAGFMATAASSPFDVIKSRVMSQPLDPLTGQGLWYRNISDCWVKSILAEGPMFMWKGFWPNYLNKGPTVVLFFMFYERIRLFCDG